MTVTSQLKIFDAQFAAGFDPMSVSSIVGMKSSTLAEWYAGSLTAAGGLADISGNGRDLTPHGTPLPAPSDSFLLGRGGNPIKNFVGNGTSQYFDRVYEASWMDFTNVTNYSISMLVKSPPSLGGIDRYYCNHGNPAVGGYGIFMNTSGYFNMHIRWAGGGYNAQYAVSKIDGLIHLLQWTRTGAALTCYCDGAVGATVNPNGCGIISNDPFYLGAFRTPANYLNGGIIYFRINNAPTTADQRAIEYNYVRGILATGGGKKYFVPTFTRAQAVMIDRGTGSKKIETVQSDWPVKGPDGSLFMHSEIPQALTYTNVFDNAVWGTNYYAGVNKTASGNRNWNRNATNSTGQYIYSCTKYAYLYVSADSGASFTEVSSMGNQNWKDIACDPTGQHVVACTNGGKIFTSHDYGVTFVEKLSIASALFSICLGVGGRGACGPNGAKVYLTSDNGDNWVQAAGSPVKTFTCICCDKTTSAIMFAWAYNDSVYKSIDFGATWSAVLSVPYININCGIACSATGQYVVVSLEGGICVSNNYGTFGTWAFPLTGTFFGGAAGCNSTGQYMAIGKNAGNNTMPIWTSANYGVTWNERSNLGLKNWTGISFFGTSSFYACGGDLSYQILCLLTLLDTVASPSATPLAPDGNATCYKLVAGVNDVEHGIIQDQLLTAFDHSFDVEAYPGDRDWIRLNNISIANCYAFFNIRLGLVGTVGAGCTASVNENRNSRFGIHFMGTAGGHSLEISPANADNDVDFAGDGATASVYIWQASCHLNKYQLPPIDRPSAVAVTRARDILSFTPASIFTNLWVGNSYRTKKLSFKWRAKNRFSSSIDMPALRMNHFCLGGNSGTAGNTRNMIWVYYSAGVLWCEIYDDISGELKYMQFNAVVNAHKYHTYVITIDFTNLSLSSFKKDGVESGFRVMPASAYNLQFTDCSFNIGMGPYSIYPACMLDLDYLTMWEHIA